MGNDVASVINWCDLVIEVLDARDPLATRNVLVERMADRKGKLLILAVNKADLVPMSVLRMWKAYLSRDRPTVFLSVKKRLGTRMLIRAIKANAPRLPVKVTVVGYPNVGKSSIINYLKERAVASVSPVPGWTRSTQVYRAKRWLIVADTPGVFSNADSKDDSLLVIRGLLNPDRAGDVVTPVVSFIKRVLSLNPGAFRDAYGVDAQDPLAILEWVARRRGFVLKGGGLNLTEAAKAVVRDWFNGKLIYYYPPPVGEHEEGKETNPGG